MTRTLFVLSLCAIAAAFALEAQAKTLHQAVDGKVSVATNTFVKKAAIGNEFEIEASKVALDRSESEPVREAAQMMIDDHTKGLEGLRAALPADIDPTLAQATLDAAHQKKLDNLRNVPAEKFNASFIAVQKEAHKEAIGAYSSYAAHGDEKDLRDYAKGTLPTLKQHQQHVNELSASKDAI